jgi:hypothetical protein
VIVTVLLGLGLAVVLAVLLVVLCGCQHEWSHERTATGWHLRCGRCGRTTGGVENFKRP